VIALLPGHLSCTLEGVSQTPPVGRLPAHDRALLEERPRRHQVALAPREVARTDQGLSALRGAPPGAGARHARQRALERAAALRPVAAVEPVTVEGARQPQCGSSVAGVGRPLKRLAEVIVLAL
jgi:hypothetical protein